MKTSSAARFCLTWGGLLSLAAVLCLAVPPLRVLPLGFVLLFRSEPRPLVMPVEGIRARDIRDSWHAPRGKGRRHQGVDIFAPRGRKVVSATVGVITSVRVDELGGRSVWVLGPAGHMHYYAHLEAWAEIRKGQWVRAGQALGEVGDSGNAKGTPTHLHYGVYRALGGAINPYPLLQKPSAPVRRAQGDPPGRTRMAILHMPCALQDLELEPC